MPKPESEMIARIEGRIVEKNPAYVVVDCQGVGYQLNITLNTYTRIPDSGTFLFHTSHIVREDAELLYGFHSRIERDMFNMLISVSGVGPASASMILSSMTPEEVQRAIVEGDVTALKSAKGIGSKTSERIIVDLRGRLSREELAPLSSIQGNTTREEALSALLMLGFNRASAEKGLARVLKENRDQVSVEQLIKAVLKGI